MAQPTSKYRFIIKILWQTIVLMLPTILMYKNSLFKFLCRTNTEPRERKTLIAVVNNVVL